MTDLLPHGTPRGGLVLQLVAGCPGLFMAMGICARLSLMKALLLQLLLLHLALLHLLLML